MQAHKRIHWNLLILFARGNEELKRKPQSGVSSE
jgi:hypothetical protein